MAGESSLRAKIESKIEHYRRAINELTDLLGAGHGGDSDDGLSFESLSVPVATVSTAEAPARKKPGPKPGSGAGKAVRKRRKRRPTGATGALIDAALTKKPGSTVGELSEIILADSGDEFKTSVINSFLSRPDHAGKYTKDTSEGPRKTRWSLAGAAAVAKKKKGE